MQSGVLVWEQGDIEENRTMHHSPIVEGNKPYFNWKVPIYIVNCEDSIQCKLGDFGDIRGECQIFAYKWRDGEHSNSDVVEIDMGGRCVLYVTGKWIEEEETQQNKNTFSAFEELKHSTKK